MAQGLLRYAPETGGQLASQSEQAAPPHSGPDTSAAGTPSLRRSPARRFKAMLGLPRGLFLGRLAYVLKRPFFALPNLDFASFGSAPAAIKFAPPDPWPGNAAFGVAIAQGLFSFGGRSIDHPAPLWRPLGADVEWLDDLHGFAWLRDLRAAGGDGGRRAARELVESWIRHNRRWSAAAWNPVTTGMRLANWLGQYEFYAASADLDLRRKVLASATRQARHLGRVLPAGLSGSELIAALKGLIYAGICLPGGGIWLDRGLAMLDREVRHQILPDGGHIERSPARQLAVLRDLIDLRAALNAAGLQVPEALHLAIEAMAPFLRLLQHGDGGLALFNDGTEEEGWRVDMVLQRAGGGKRPLMEAPQGGFQRLQAGRSIVLADAGDPPPPGYDAHAHAGTLSFEMSVGRERLIVNCGAHSGRPDWRLAQRSSAAHSTLSLNDTNSSEVFDGAGLGRRPAQVSCQREEDQGNHWLEMSHDGFVAGFGLVHRRRLFLAANGDDFRGEDRLTTGASRRVKTNPQFAIRFHLHPAVQATVAQAGDSVFLRTPKGSSWRLRCAGASLHLEPSVYLGYVGEVRRCQQIVLRGSAEAAETTVKWALRREGGK